MKLRRTQIGLGNVPFATLYQIGHALREVNDKDDCVNLKKKSDTYIAQISKNPNFNSLDGRDYLLKVNKSCSSSTA